jgi:hypothetical protein
LSSKKNFDMGQRAIIDDGGSGFVGYIDGVEDSGSVAEIGDGVDDDIGGGFVGVDYDDDISK